VLFNFCEIAVDIRGSTKFGSRHREGPVSIESAAVLHFLAPYKFLAT